MKRKATEKRKIREISFKETDFKGSRYCCLFLTALEKTQLLIVLNKLIVSFGKIDQDDTVIPHGFKYPSEANLANIPEKILPKETQELLESWWLSKDAKKLPNWDVVCTCEIGGKKGLLLIEAKAHSSELKKDDGTTAKGANRRSIYNALNDINNKTGWKLSIDDHYQLSNRFAWSWKLAQMGIPVILVYLGFINAWEGGGDGFVDKKSWESSLSSYSKAIVPEIVWNKELKGLKSPFCPLIRSLTMNISFKEPD
jgi:hypothetical protein